MNTKEDQMDLQKVPQLTKGTSTYKLIVPKEVEAKIRYLIRKYPSTEWSGVLFYTHQGTFEDNNLIITCKDIYPMDLGTSGWTEFHMSEDVAAYIAENIELFDCETGLVHSHHSLGAFFSSQDIKMLAQEGNDTNCFVSLVVDTKGTYVAAITRKIQNTSEVTVKNLGISYEFFGEGTVNLESSKEEKHKIVDNVSIEYFNLEVERHQVPNTLAYLDTRFEEINRKKAQNNKTTTSFSLFDTPFKSEISNIKNQCLFADDVMESLKSSNISNIKKEEEEDIDWAPDPKYIDKAIVNIITCSLLINPKKFKLEEWITKYMSSAYRNIFGNKELSEDEIITGQPFTEWVDFIIGWTLDHFPIDEEAEINYGVDYCTRVIAEILYLKLSEYSTISPYVNVYCETLAFYLET